MSDYNSITTLLKSGMKMDQRPLVSIGLPVYNGENYLEPAIESFLHQSIKNIEIVISDNASTDGTQEICRRYENKDARVRYFRNERNTGSAANFTKVFKLSRGDYFKWAAHDDVCEPRFLEACIEILHSDRWARLAFARAITIDARGRKVNLWRVVEGLDHPDPIRRLRAVLRVGETIPLWGLMRRNELAQTGLLGPYVFHDMPLLAEISLAGKIVMVDDPLFLHREHADRSIRKFHSNLRKAIVFYDSSRSSKFHLPIWRLLWEYKQAASRAPISSMVRLSAYKVVLRMAAEERAALVGELAESAEDLPFVGSQLKLLRKRGRNYVLRRHIQFVRKQILEFAGRHGKFMLVDSGELDRTLFDQDQIVDLQADQGNPANDIEAWARVRTGLAAGVTVLILLKPALWWRDFYLDCFRVVERWAVRKSFGKGNIVYIFDQGVDLEKCDQSLAEAVDLSYLDDGADLMGGDTVIEFDRR